MSNTESLHDLGQSLWLDNITREMLDDGTLQRYIEKYSITGLTSNPPMDEIFWTRAIRHRRLRQGRGDTAKGQRRQRAAVRR